MTGVRGTGIRLSYRDYKLNLLAGVEQRLEVIGNYWQVIEAVGPVRLSFDESASIVRVAGTGGPAEYTRVTVRSDIDQAVVITLGQTLGMVPYDRAVSSFEGTLNVLASNPTATPSLDDLEIAAGATVVIDAALAARLNLIVQLISYDAPDLSTYTGFRIGDSSVSATRGTFVTEAVQWSGAAAVYIYNPNPQAITISRQRETIP